MSITPSSLPATGTERRYPELYQFCASLESRGRRQMATAWIYGLVFGLLMFGLGITTLPEIARQAPDLPVLILSVGLALVLGYALYRYVFDRGFRMVIEAQRTLVLVDTENNTRRIAERIG